MREILFVAGLPGSGKTTYLCQLCRDGWSIFDDFKANARCDSKKFRNARMFDELIKKLHDGLPVAVADIDFCNRESRDEAESVLREEIPDTEIQWCFFAHDVDACRKNIIRRDRPSRQDELAKLCEYSSLYCIPVGACVRAIGGITDY